MQVHLETPRAMRHPPELDPFRPQEMQEERAS